MFNKLRTVVYHVSDLKKATEWYTEITGIAPYFEEPFYVGFNINGFELGLDPDCTNITSGNHSHVFWSVNNLEASLQKCLNAGATMVQEVQEVGGGITIAVVQDLWGNAIGLIEEVTTEA